MPILSRLDWISKQVDMGRCVHIHVGRAFDVNKSKIRFVLPSPASATINVATAFVVKELISSIRRMCSTDGVSCMDRGHKHSDGTSEVSIWLRRSQSSAPGQPFDSAPLVLVDQPPASTETIGSNGGSMGVALAESTAPTMPALVPVREADSGAAALAPAPNYSAIVGSRFTLRQRYRYQSGDVEVVWPVGVSGTVVELYGNLRCWVHLDGYPKETHISLQSLSQITGLTLNNFRGTLQ